MEPSLSIQKTIQHQYDSFAKIVLRNEARDAYAEYKSQQVHEVYLSELTEQELELLSVTDEYFTNERDFNVFGYDVDVKDEILAEAIKTLPQQMRDIILLSYFVDMSDVEIGKMLNLVSRTVQYKRTNSLSVLKKIMEAKSYENN